ncbi:MAG: AhpC/TSA family [Verrucomicrobiota bacterium]
MTAENNSFGARRAPLQKKRMKRNWNWSLWIGFLFMLAGFLSYIFFVQFPITRDFPWANFLLFGVGGILLVLGLARAFGKRGRYRGQVFGPILAVLSVLVFAFFSYIVFYELKQLPASVGAPHLGQKAPDFTLPDQDGKQVALADLISTSATGGKPGGAVLIFYRGFW